MNNSIKTVSTLEQCMFPAAIKKMAADVCTVCCFLTSLNGIVQLPQFPITPSVGVSVVSAESTHWNMYNSGKINVLWTGDSTAMKTDILESYKRIDEIAQLEDNWNNNGAESFSNELLNTVRGVVVELAKQPKIFPTARKSIQLEYENDNGDYLEFELFEDNQTKEFFYSHNGASHTRFINKNSIIEVVNTFYGLQIRRE